MKALKKAVAVLCAFSLVAGTALAAFAAPAEVDYTITNPYETVNWDSYSQFKADFHSHTTASDGTSTLKEMIEAHYDRGFDIVAVTDHGTSSYSWSQPNFIPAFKVAVALVKDRGEKIEVLDPNGGTAANGNAYSYKESEQGDFYHQTDANGVNGQKMLRVPYAIENNPSSINNAHVNSWFIDYGNGRLGGTSDYVTPISKVDKLGGLSVINHPGEYTNARDEVYTKDAYDLSNAVYKYKVNKFASLLLKYPTCLGIDVNSKGDSRTRFDRKLWDILLTKVVPHGRNVFAFATSDAHNVDAVYSGYTLMCMPSNTVANLKTCMANGAFFAASKYLGNYDELKEIAGYLAQKGNSPDVLTKLNKICADSEAAMAGGGSGGKYEAPFDVEAPKINRVTVDEQEDTIALETTRNVLVTRWIANGVTIATGNFIDLDDYSDKIGSYVRAEIFGEGGIVYTQAFTLDYDGAPAPENIPDIDLWWLASVIPDNIVRVIAAFPFFKQIWDLMSK